MSKIQEQILRDANETAQAIRDARLNAAVLVQCSTTIAEELNKLDMNLRVMVSKGLLKPRALEEIQKITNRSLRLRELRNMSEFGSFQITVERAMETAWEGLP